MILTKRDLKFYLSEDARALGYDKLPFVKRFIRVHFDKRIKFHIELRKFEYYSNKFAKQNRGGQILVSSNVPLSLFYLQKVILYFRIYNP